MSASFFELGVLSPDGAGSCAGLPAHPTPQQILDAGFITDVSGTTVAVSALLGFFSFCCSVPQIVKFVKRRSVRSVSMLYTIAHMAENVFHLASVIATDSPQFSACQAISSWQCFANTLPCYQTMGSGTGATAIFATFTYYWYHEMPGAEASESSPQLELEPGGESGVSLAGLVRPKPRIAEGACLIAGAIVTAASVIFMVVLPTVAGVCGSAVAPARNAVALVSTVLNVAAPIPQIVVLVRVKEVGSVSWLTIALYSVGSFIYIGDFLTQNQPIATVLPYVASFVMYLVQLVLVAYYECCRRGGQQPEHGSWSD